MKFVAFIMFVSSSIFAQQNLVPNWSFEQYTSCPSAGTLNFCSPWFPSNNQGSSDAYNTCYNSINQYNGVPYNTSFQYPRTGNGYAGISLFWDTTLSDRNKWREYIEVELSDSLKNGKRYCVMFYTVKGNWSKWAIKNIQAALTSSIITYNDPNFNYISSVSPIIESASIIFDTVNWVSIKGEYFANGGERYLTIGNFSAGNQVVYQEVWPFNGSQNTLGYYFFDDVSVYELPEINAGADTVICPWHSTIVGPANVRSDIQYSWSPSYGLSDSMVANPIASPLQTTTYVLTVTDTNQWACYPQMYDTITITVSGCTSIEESIANTFTSVFPNPCNGSFYFKEALSEPSLIELFDLSGKKVLQKKVATIKTNEMFDAGFLEEGVYQLKISSVGKISYTKIIVKR